MKGAIASVEIFAHRPGEAPRRLSLTIAAPDRDPDGMGWVCRVVLANLHRPRSVGAADSVAALAAAIDCARAWLAALDAQGFVLTRDRAGEAPFEPF